MPITPEPFLWPEPRTCSLGPRVEAPRSRWADAAPLWTQAAGQDVPLAALLHGWPRRKRTRKAALHLLAEQSTAATQRLTLARQLIAALPSEGVSAEDIAVSWNALLRYASQQANGRNKGTGRFALILDDGDSLFGQDQGTFNQVLEFADVAGPVVRATLRRFWEVAVLSSAGIFTAGGSCEYAILPNRGWPSLFAPVVRALELHIILLHNGAECSSGAITASCGPA